MFSEKDIIKTQKNSNMRTPMCCIVTDSKNNIITHGYNYDVPLNGSRNRYSIHAEEMALRKLLNNKKYKLDQDYFFWVFRYSNGKLKNSKPCKTCRQFLKNKNFFIYYFENGKLHGGWVDECLEMKE